MYEIQMAVSVNTVNAPGAHFIRQVEGFFNFGTGQAIRKF